MRRRWLAVLGIGAAMLGGCECTQKRGTGSGCCAEKCACACCGESGDAERMSAAVRSDWYAKCTYHDSVWCRGPYDYQDQAEDRVNSHNLTYHANQRIAQVVSENCFEAVDAE